ncbi:MAG: hypothetical protein ACRD19_14285 [Terriglobia bacterium]
MQPRTLILAFNCLLATNTSFDYQARRPSQYVLRNLAGDTASDPCRLDTSLLSRLDRKGIRQAITRVADLSVQHFESKFDQDRNYVPLYTRLLAAGRKFIAASNHLAQGAPIDGHQPSPEGPMLRSELYKYCVYSERDGRESLVDLVADRGEMQNLANEPMHCAKLLGHRRMVCARGFKINDLPPYPPEVVHP